MSKIFQLVHYSDGGPNDHGHIIEYQAADSKPKDAPMMCDWEEITWERFKEKQLAARKALELFHIPIPASASKYVEDEA